MQRVQRFPRIRFARGFRCVRGACSARSARSVHAVCSVCSARSAGLACVRRGRRMWCDGLAHRVRRVRPVVRILGVRRSVCDVGVDARVGVVVGACVGVCVAVGFHVGGAVFLAAKLTWACALIFLFALVACASGSLNRAVARVRDARMFIFTLTANMSHLRAHSKPYLTLEIRPVAHS